MTRRFNQSRGYQPTATESKRGIRSLVHETLDTYTMDVAVVKSYDHAAGTVDLWLKADSRQNALRAVPVWGRGGTFRFVIPLTGTDEGEIDEGVEPDVGYVCYVRMDPTGLFRDFLRRINPLTRRHNQPEPVMFLPFAAITSQTATPGVVATPAVEDIGPDDFAIVNPTGQNAIILKGDGEVLLQAGPGKRVTALAFGETVSSAQDNSREGDSGADLGIGGSSIIRSTSA